MSVKAISIQDIGFGDSGKGLFTDAVVRAIHARLVVRFNGGGQAGHNVVDRSQAHQLRHHTFSQFGSGSFSPAVSTLLLHPFVLHPTALLVELKHLQAQGVEHALKRLNIDGRCRITTPYHQAAGRLREKLRATQAHGTCGVGFGETVRHSLNAPSEVLTYAQLCTHSLEELGEKLQRIRRRLTHELLLEMPHRAPNVAMLQGEEWIALNDENLASRWLNATAPLRTSCPPLDMEQMQGLMTESQCAVFEGAQGVLLDEWRGFHPHTTWSQIHTDAVDAAAAQLGIAQPVMHIGVMRSYLTRHGAGPLPSEHAMLNTLAEPHNDAQGWQGEFRRGHPDQLMLRYASKAIGHLDALAVSHLDVFDSATDLFWVNAYRDSLTGEEIRAIDYCEQPDLTFQARLTAQLSRAKPIYDRKRISSAQEFMAQVQSISQLPVWMQSSGPTAADVDLTRFLNAFH